MLLWRGCSLAEQLCRHMLVCGATGSGKTETLLRLVWTIAKSSEARIWYMDGKGDRETAERFKGLMEVIDYAREGPAVWYRDVAKTVVTLTCEQPQGPPRSAREALERMDVRALGEAHPGSSALAALSEERVHEVRLRYEAFFGQTRGALDGEWSWQDTSAAYLLLDSLALREETSSLARFLLEDFAQYFSRRKPREEYCVLVVDEFAALAGATGMAGKVEQARGFEHGADLGSAGCGGDRQRARAGTNPRQRRDGDLPPSEYA